MAPSPKPPSGGGKGGLEGALGKVFGIAGAAIRGEQIKAPADVLGFKEGQKYVPTLEHAQLYKSGSEMDPINWSPEEVYNLQLILNDLGLLGSFTAYVWDGPSQNAYRKALAGANQYGVPIQQYLNMVAQGQVQAGGGPGGGSGGGGAGAMGDYQLPVINVDNPDDLREIFKEASATTLGYEVTDEEINSMVLAYTGMQIQRQQQGLGFAMQEREAQLAGQMGFGEPVVVEGEQAPADWAAKWYRGSRPADAAGYKGLNQLKAVDAALGFNQ